jgi:hypothetical protein
MGLVYKLIVAPLLILILYAGLIGLRGRTTEVTWFEAAMPPQIGGSIVAIQYGLADFAHGGQRHRRCVSHAAGLVAGVRVSVGGDFSELLVPKHTLSKRTRTTRRPRATQLGVF